MHEIKKVLLMTDLEGAAGVVSFSEQAFPDGKYFDEARRLLTSEVNAAVDGLLEAGVEDVLVIDGHRSGGISFQELHPTARLLHGRPLAPWDRLAPVIADHQAAAFVGQHAMAGVTTGALSHTQNSRTIDYYKLNGHPIGEIAQFALYCGELGLPAIFLSGDREACAEAQELVQGIETVAVKIGLGRTSAISLSPLEARRAICEGARRAVERHNRHPIQPLTWPGPYVLEIRYLFTTDADARAAEPGVERVDGHTVRLASASLLDVIYR